MKRESNKRPARAVKALFNKLDPTSKAFDELDKAMDRLSKAKWPVSFLANILITIVLLLTRPGAGCRRLKMN